jgi:hypothetical protein
MSVSVASQNLGMLWFLVIVCLYKFMKQYIISKF